MKTDKLIFDVGAHKGEDTVFYLESGYRVIAIEANPELCAQIQKQCESYVSSGALTVLNVAIADRAANLEFYIDDDVSVWGTANPEWVERNRVQGAGRKIRKMTIPAVTLASIVEKYGVPQYCKIDIEGNDLAAVSSLIANRCPKYLSIESEKSSWDNLITEFRMFEALGYRKYKIVDQTLVSFQPHPTGSKFEEGSSGLFGEDAPGQWLTALEAIEVYKGIFRGYALNGDMGLLKTPLFRLATLINKQAYRLRGFKGYETTRQPPAGWYDTHASL